MPTPSIKFKVMLLRHDRNTRMQILSALDTWINNQFSVDPKSQACRNAMYEILMVNSWATDKELKDHILWYVMSNHDSCVSFQEIVKAKLGVPMKNISVAVKNVDAPPRKSIPKKVRGEVWSSHFGSSMDGGCYCCKKSLHAFDDWHAGHIIAHANGGNDSASNLRPVCGSCNLSMGTENMDAFKARCYS
jgi:hypothetical protein